MGFYLLHESMLDSILTARDKHLKEDGILLPSHAQILAGMQHNYANMQWRQWTLLLVTLSI